MPNYPRPTRHLERAKQMRRSMTSAETAVWNIVRKQRLGWRFRRQEPIGPFIVDFVCVARRLVVEMDGEGHGGDYDQQRDAYLRQLGFRVLRIANDALADRGWVEDQIKSWTDDPNRR
jgi:very-short-patch-repair endonuclease